MNVNSAKKDQKFVHQKMPWRNMVQGRQVAAVMLRSLYMWVTRNESGPDLTTLRIHNQPKTWSEIALTLKKMDQVHSSLLCYVLCWWSRRCGPYADKECRCSIVTSADLANSRTPRVCEWNVDAHYCRLL